MQRLLLTLILSSLTVACGAQQGARKSISEGAEHGEANVSTSSDPAYHSLVGWQALVSFYVSSDAPDEVVEAAQNAAQTWGNAVGQPVLKFAGVAEAKRSGDLYKSLDDNTTYVYYEHDWAATTGKASTTLATTVWENATDSDRIVKGDVILNAETYTFLDTMKDIPEADENVAVVDSETVLLHEFGHLLGLDHIPDDQDPDSIMHAKTFIGPNLSFREPSEQDIAHMKKLYP